jgi:hypothetical protein
MTSADPDVRLRVVMLPVNSQAPVTVEFFPWNAWDEAILWAYQQSIAPPGAVARWTVVDAWGTMIAQFLPLWLVRKEEPPKAE